MSTKGLFWITKGNGGVDFDDLKNGRISYVEAYRRQLQSWLFDPICRLLNEKSNHDLKIAALSLQFMYFEPHGQFLEGEKEGRNKSKKLFVLGMKRFIASNEQNFHESTRNDIFYGEAYAWVRCGLMHSLTLGDNISIDVYGLGKDIVSSIGYSGTHYIINPVRLFKEIQIYSDNYLRELDGDHNSQLYKNFKLVYEDKIIRRGMELEKLFPQK